ncbi:putative Endonuclease/exonuclease/phosphatase superfamily [Helianthus annuus]|nr:putative Endonuclease/exonuclease/phosphatase superfamily [Helianthus annuus]KAJ0562853.1 putative Endonuclease/exonuclease/phosphatase superfamily [Helianthus annuus]
MGQFGRKIRRAIISLRPAFFNKTTTVRNQNFLQISGALQGGEVMHFINIHAPQNLSKKQELWRVFSDQFGNMDELWVVMGNFNAVRSQEERLNTDFVLGCAEVLNEFIKDNGLMEYPMGDMKYIRVSDTGDKLSKLDRFLVSSSFRNWWPDATVMVLSRCESDYYPNSLSTSDLFKEDLVKIMDTFHEDGIINRECGSSFLALIPKGGIPTLLKATLDCLPLYFSYLFNAPQGVLDKLKAIRRRFFWGGNDEKAKTTWVYWERVIDPIEKGGLGLGSLKDMNISLLLKWWWRFKHEKDSLWGKTVRAIHEHTHSYSYVLIKECIPGTWNNIVRIRKELKNNNVLVESLIKGDVGTGKKGAILVGLVG